MFPPRILVFEQAGDKVKCRKCAPLIHDESRKWIASTGWKAHISSAMHARALKREEESDQRAAKINRADQAAIQENEPHQAEYAPLTYAPITSSSHPMAPGRMITAAEDEMWQDIEMGDVIYDAGTAPDLQAEKRRLQRDIDKFGLWNADRMGAELGAGVDDFALGEQEDDILAEILQNAREFLSLYDISIYSILMLFRTG